MLSSSGCTAEMFFHFGFTEICVIFVVFMNCNVFVSLSLSSLFVTVSGSAVLVHLNIESSMYLTGRMFRICPVWRAVSFELYIIVVVFKISKPSSGGACMQSM